MGSGGKKAEGVKFSRSAKQTDACGMCVKSFVRENLASFFLKKAVGQMVFEFVIAVIVFLALVLYTLSFLNSNVTSYGDAMLINELENRAVAATEVLTKSEGVWSGATPISIGLAEKWPVLSREKIARFIAHCNPNGKTDVYKKLDLGGYSARIVIKSDYMSSTVLCSAAVCSCGDSVPNKPKAYVKRYGLVKDVEYKVVGIEVWVWK